MRGIHSVVDDIRRDVFTEVARLAYEGGDFRKIDLLPYKIIPGEVAQYRHDVFLERAIVEEREANGPFSSPEDIMRVSGIGEKKFARLEAMICV